MDYLIENILEYLKEAGEKHWSDHIIKFDLNRMLTNYVEDYAQSRENDLIAFARECNSIEDFLDRKDK